MLHEVFWFGARRRSGGRHDYPAAAVVPHRHHQRTIAPLNPFSPPQIVTAIKPQANSDLEGLYKSSGNYCTQCEAEGFRGITYFLDRPDVMAK